MSFNFDNDKVGTTTSVRENGEAAVDMSGEATPALKACGFREYLALLKAKGVKVCDDIQVLGGDLYLGSGVGTRSMVKDMGLVFGEHDGVTAGDAGFTPADPDSAAVDSSTETVQNAKWYIRMVRPDQQIHFADFKPLNDLMKALQSDGNVRSVLEAVQQLNELRENLDAILAANAIASTEDINALERLIDRDIVTMHEGLEGMEAALLEYIEEQDAALHAYITERLEKSGTDGFVPMYNGTKVSITRPLADGTPEADCMGESPLLATGAISLFNHSEIREALIQVRVIENAGGFKVARNDIDVSWRATCHPQTNEITISYFVNQLCNDEMVDFSSLELNVTVVDCGTITASSGAKPDFAELGYSPIVGAGHALEMNDGERDSDLEGQKTKFTAPA